MIATARGHAVNTINVIVADHLNRHVAMQRELIFLSGADAIAT
ncbi:MAG TPA: hypothetical protein VGF69_13630 [Thermoanaerobaculia bacterium]|jgi:hypothetical protein